MLAAVAAATGVMMLNHSEKKDIGTRNFYAVAYNEAGNKDEPIRTLYPPISPNKSGYLKVSDLHTIHYQEYGNPKGKPVLFVHGGPGAGTSPKVMHTSVYFLLDHPKHGNGRPLDFSIPKPIASS